MASGKDPKVIAARIAQDCETLGTPLTEDQIDRMTEIIKTREHFDICGKPQEGTHEEKLARRRRKSRESMARYRIDHPRRKNGNPDN